MGHGPSSLNFTNLDDGLLNKDNIFETAFDDIPLSQEFISTILPKNPKDVVHPINPPCDSLIGCMMSDPLIYTQVGTQAEVWLNVLIPLFKGNVNSSPYFQQAITEYFKFLTDRSISALKQEEAKRNLEIETTNQEIRNILRAFTDQKEGRKNISEEEIKALKSSSELIAKIKGYNPNCNRPGFSPYIGSRPATEYMISLLSDTNNLQDVFNTVEWGLYCGDISPLIAAFTRSLDFLNVKGNVSTGIDSFKNIIGNLPMFNSIPVPETMSLIGSSPIEKFKISSHTTYSILTCDGNYVYALGSHSTIHQISLSKTISNVSSRFSSKEIKVEKKERIMLGMTNSNGYILITGPFLSGQKLLKTVPLELLDANIKTGKSFFGGNKLSLPLASDGYFIYSISGSKLNIYSLQQQSLVLNRTVKLVKSNAILTESFSSRKLIPDLSDAMMISNGVVLTIVKPSSKASNTAGKFNYAVRHFTLIDGCHIIDSEFYLRTPLISMCLDPWNKCIWCLGARENNGGTLLKFKMQGALPMWLTGIDPLTLPQRSATTNFLSAKNAVSLAIGLIDFINFYISHLEGSSFNVSGHGSPDQAFTIPRFFAPGTTIAIDTIVAAIERVEYFIKSKQFSGEWNLRQCMKAMTTLVYLLDFNLSNFHIHTVGGKNIEFNESKRIMDLLISLYEDSQFRFLRPAIIFTYINSFEFLIYDKESRADKIFISLFETANQNVMLFLITNLSKAHLFPYCFTVASCRKIFAGILKKMTSASSDISRNQFEIVYSFLRLTIFELYQAYELNTGELPSQYKSIQDNFLTFSGLVTEEMIRLINNIGTQKLPVEMVQFQPFIRLFQKWILLLRPFVTFSRMSGNIVSILQPLFMSFSAKINDLNLKTQLNSKGNGFTFIYGLFYDLFSLYVEFISALLDGGSELKDIQQYTWLVKSTLLSGLTSEKVDMLTESFDAMETKNNGLLRKGFSFNSIEKKSEEDVLINSFIDSLIAHEESNEIKQFMNYIYLKVNDPYNKKLSPEERHTERILLSVLIKHLGFASAARDLSLTLSSGQKPVLNHYIRQAISSIYRIRRQLKLVKQEWTKLTDKAKENMTVFRPSSLYEDYPQLKLEIRKKCIFLLHIQPCNRFNTEENGDIFSNMMKHITNFITANVSLASYFDLLKDSQAIQANIATGLELINRIFLDNKNQVFTSYVAERFASSSSISTYLKSIADTPKNSAVDSHGFRNVMTLMNNVRRFVVSDSKEFQKNTLLVFFANLLFSLSSVAPEQVFDPLTDLVKQIFAQKDTFLPESFPSLISFLISSICVIFEMNPGMKTSKSFHALCEIMDPFKEYAVSHQAIGMLFFRAGMLTSIDALSIFNILASADPIQFQPICSFIYELMSKMDDKSLVIFPIFEQISLVASGRHSMILESRPTIIEGDNTQNVATPNIILAGATVCIQLIRKLLQKGDPCVHQIISYILRINMRMEVDKIRYVHFSNPRMLFAVFAILSNVIDVLHFSSVLKSTNKNEMFYVNEFDKKSQKLKVWSLPITQNSHEELINPGDEYVNTPLVPFSTSMFKDYESLIPYFKKFMNQSKSNLQEGLSYYVIASLKEYVDVPEIQKSLPEIFGDKMDLSHQLLTFSDSKDKFMKLLSSHLYDPFDGMLAINSATLKFQYCSATTVPSKTYLLNEKQIETKGNEYYVFLTQPLPENTTSYLSMSATLYGSTVSFSIHEPSINKMSYERLQVELLKQDCCRAVSDEKIVNILAKSNEITLSYNPETKVGEIFIGNHSSTVLTHQFTGNCPLFCIEVIGRANIKYAFAKASSFYSVIDSENEKLFDYKSLKYQSIAKKNDGLLNMNGQMVFKKNKNKFFAINDDVDYDEPNNENIQAFSRIQPQFKAKEKVDIDVRKFIPNFVSMNKSTCVAESFNWKKDPTIVITEDVYKQASTYLNIYAANRITPPKRNPVIYQESSFPIRSLIEREDVQLFDLTQSIFNITFNISERYHLNLMTGEFGLSTKSAALRDVAPFVHPDDMYYMPPSVLNYFITGYSESIRKEVITQTYIKYLSMATQPKAFDEVTKLFNCCDVNKLIRQMISLLTLCEQSDQNDLIHFGTNYLDQAESVPSSVQHYHAAALSIYEYFLKNQDLKEKFVDAFFNNVHEMFNYIKWHFTLDNNPNAYFYNGMGAKASASIKAKFWIIMDPVKFTVEIKAILDIPKNTTKCICIPVFDHTCLLGTFVEMLVGLKYLVYTVKDVADVAGTYRPQIYTMFIDSLIVKSPYCTLKLCDIFGFLNKNLPVASSDINGDFLIRLNILSSYKNSTPAPIQQFLEDLQNIWDERVLLPLKSYFPEFLTSSEIEETKKIKKEPLHLVSDQFPREVSSIPSLVKKSIGIVKRSLLNRNDIVGFPFHFVITIWAEHSVRYPSVTTTVNNKVLKVKFNTYVPSKICIKTMNPAPFDVEVLSSPDEKSGTPCKSNNIQTGSNQVICILSKEERWVSYDFIIQATSNDITSDKFISVYRDRFVTDITSLSVHWVRRNDQKILHILGINSYNQETLRTDIDPLLFVGSNISDELVVIIIRAKLLLILNWLFNFSYLKFGDDLSLNYLNESVAASLKLRKLLELTRKNSKDGRDNIRIDRKKGFDVREGLSNDLQSTIINQVSLCYDVRKGYRENSDRPWHVEFKNENGIDAGGLARELVTEIAKDINSPNCGLCIPVPNARNEVGGNREYVIPIPNPKTPNQTGQYRFIGVFIGICIRTGLVQEINFPPIVWEYLISGKITIDMIFEIDQNYKLLIESLDDARRSGITEEEFSKQFNIKFVIYNSAGVECPLKTDGRTESVTLSNVSRFISLANEYRLKEMIPYLEPMRSGLLENLEFNPREFVDWATLELGACGEKEIHADDFIRIVEFRDSISTTQRNWFFNILRKFSPEERSALLRFATGRIRLPPKESSNQIRFVIDSLNETDKMPTASTCFHQLHMPNYTSEEKMYVLIRAAACFTGSIENS